MKQSDIAAVILIVAVSLIASWFIFNAIIPESSDQQFEVEVVDAIDPEFDQPSNRVFKKGYLNPTELIIIDKNNNNQPFSGR